MPRVSKKVLSEQLKQMEGNRMIQRIEVCNFPPEVCMIHPGNQDLSMISCIKETMIGILKSIQYLQNIMINTIQFL